MTAPLTGHIVIDLTQGVAGPYCTRALSDLGARVIKVERPGTGDDARAYPPFKEGRSALFTALNHGKASIALDLKTDTDKILLERLLARADIVIENARPGALDRLGYGWDSLHVVFPTLIYASLSGFGQTGPDARRPAYDLVAQARGGLMALTGERGRDPQSAGAPVAEVAAAMFLTQGVLVALLERARTGKGRRVDVSMLDAQLAFLDQAVTIAGVTGRAPAAAGTRHPAIAPCESVQASDGPFVLAAGNDRLFEKLCIALSLPLTGDPRFATNADRCAHARLLRRLIEAVTIEHPRAHWIARLTAAGVPVAPVQGIDQVMKDPQILARNMVVDVLDRHGRAAVKSIGNPVKISEASDPTTRRPAPELDANRGEILRWLDGG